MIWVNPVWHSLILFNPNVKNVQSCQTDFCIKSYPQDTGAIQVIPDDLSTFCMTLKKLTPFLEVP